MQENQELRAAIQELQQRHAELQQRYTQLEQNLLHSKLRKSQSMMDFEKESAPAASDEKFTPGTLAAWQTRELTHSLTHEPCVCVRAEQRYIAKVAFSKYDVDGNGTIDHHELKAILEELRYVPSIWRLVRACVHSHATRLSLYSKNGVLRMSDTLFKRYVGTQRATAARHWQYASRLIAHQARGRHELEGARRRRQRCHRL